MSSFQKVALSSLVSVILFVACGALLYTGGFKFFEVKFYQPRIISGINQDLDQIGNAFNEYYKNLDSVFSSYVKENSVKTYINRNVEKQDAIDRENHTGRLFELNPGLEGIRLIENDGFHIHYSTYKSDILKETETFISYRNYTDGSDIPFNLIEAKEEDGSRFYWDSSRNILMLSYPLLDNYTAYRGDFIFYVSGDDFTRYLITHDLISLNTRATVCAAGGYVFGLPYTGRQMLLEIIEEKWGRKLFGLEQLVETDDPHTNYFLISRNKTSTVNMGWICSQTDFQFFEIQKLLLLISLLISTFLIIFLLFSLKHDDIVVINSRIRKFQYALLKEYIERKNSGDNSDITREIFRRKIAVNAEIKKSLGLRGKKYSAQVDALLDKSFSEIMDALSGNIMAERKAEATVEHEIIKNFRDADFVEELPEISKNQAEPVEELEEIEEVEPVEELAEIEEAEPVEELEEIEEAEPVEELEEIEEAESVEELDEIEEAEPVEELSAEEFMIAEEKPEIIEKTLEEFQEEEQDSYKQVTEYSENKKHEAEVNFVIQAPDFSSLNENRE